MLCEIQPTRAKRTIYVHQSRYRTIINHTNTNDTPVINNTPDQLTAIKRVFVPIQSWQAYCLTTVLKKAKQNRCSRAIFWPPYGFFSASRCAAGLMKQGVAQNVFMPAPIVGDPKDEHGRQNKSWHQMYKFIVKRTE
jgi:hypothetical protein